MDPFVFSGKPVPPASRIQHQLPLTRLPVGGMFTLPVDILHGSRPGPALWLSGAIHGDEIVGVEIIRQVLNQIDETELAGTIVATPVVNVFGFLAESRYLPDRRDLNRCFPGSKRGSLGAQLARMFLDEIVSVCQYGVDFHAGSDDRTNLPQIRGNMDDPKTRTLAEAFGAPLMIHSEPMKGTLRASALKSGKCVLLYEGGEPRRFSPKAVDAGVAGTLRVLTALGMTDVSTVPVTSTPRLSRSATWIRAPRGGIFRLETRLGARVHEGQRLGVIGSPDTRTRQKVLSTVTGTVMGHAVNPLVHRGDSLVHIALDDDAKTAPSEAAE